MISVLLALFKLPDGGLPSVGVPLMLSVFLPTEQARFVLPLIRTSAENQARFLPNAATRKIKACGIECSAEVESLRVGMEYIDGRIVCHDLFHIRKGIKEEVEELMMKSVA